MALARVNNGMYCIGNASIPHTIDIGDDTTETDNAIASSAKIVVVGLHVGYVDIGPGEATMEVSDGTNSDVMTVNDESFGSGDDLTIIYSITSSQLSNVSAMSDITEFIFDGVSSGNASTLMGFAAFSSGGVPTVEDADGEVNTTVEAAIDLTGLATDDHVWLMGETTSGQTLTLTNQGQSSVETGGTCGALTSYGMAEKTADNSTETIEADGSPYDIFEWSSVYGIAIRDPGGPAGPPFNIFHEARQHTYLRM